MKVFNCVQYSPDWWDVRRGIPTCSQFDRIITPKTEKISEGCEGYIHELIADRMRQTPNFLTENEDRPKSRDMEHGILTEPEARRFYEMDRNIDVTQVGFLLSDCGRYGGSPDGLIGSDGGLELKCPKMKTHVRYLLDRKLPDEYKAQVHGLLIVTGRPWWDFMSYVGPDVDPLIVRVEPTEYTRNLRIALEMFLERLARTVEKLKAGGVDDHRSKS